MFLHKIMRGRIAQRLSDRVVSPGVGLLDLIISENHSDRRQCIGALSRNSSTQEGTMNDPEHAIDRRTFLGKSAALTVGGAAFASTALSYSRMAGANDRISLCHIGNGSRGEDLDWIVSKLTAAHNVE